jgi:hypothetical protein
MKARKLTVLSVMMSAACLGLAVLPGTAFAGTLDQEQTAFPALEDLWADQSLAQTFTAGITGRLDRVDLLLANAGPATTPPVEVQIRDLGSVGPGPTVLASATLPAASIPAPATFVPVTFASPAAVAAGVRYAIVAYSSDPSDAYVWGGQVADPYPRGALFATADSPPSPSTSWALPSGGTRDQAFKTYVATSPPTVAPPAPKKKCRRQKKKRKSRAAAVKKCKKGHAKKPR